MAEGCFYITFGLNIYIYTQINFFTKLRDRKILQIKPSIPQLF